MKKVYDVIIECRDCGGVSESRLSEDPVKIGEESPFECYGICGDEKKFILDYDIAYKQNADEYEGEHSIPKWVEVVELADVVIGRGKNPLQEKVKTGEYDSVVQELGYRCAEDLEKASVLVVNDEGIYWIITQLSDGSWVAWDEKEFNPPEYFSTREEAIDFFRKRFEEKELPETAWLINSEKRPTLEELEEFFQKDNNRVTYYKGYKILYSTKKAAAMFPTYAVVKDGKMKTLVDVSDIDYQGEFLDAVVQKYERMKEEKEIEEFFSFETRMVDRGYIIHYPVGEGEAFFPAHAVVEDADGEKELVDVSEVNFQDFDEFVSAVIEKYEKLNRA